MVKLEYDIKVEWQKITLQLYMIQSTNFQKIDINKYILDLHIV